MFSLYKKEWERFKNVYYKHFKLAYLLGILVVAAVYIVLQPYPKITNDTIQGALEGAKSSISATTDGSISVQLFFHNLLSNAIILLLGLIPFVILTYVMLLFNFGLMGAILVGVKMKNISVFLMIVTGILPHGIFEITAMILSISYSVHISTMATNNIIKKEKNYIPFAKECIRVIRGFLLINVPLLMIAALIEAFITPNLVQLVVK